MFFVVEESVEAVGARREREQKKVNREKEWNGRLQVFIHTRLMGRIDGFDPLFYLSLYRVGVWQF